MNRRRALTGDFRGEVMVRNRWEGVEGKGRVDWVRGRGEEGAGEGVMRWRRSARKVPVRKSQRSQPVKYVSVPHTFERLIRGMEMGMG